VVSLEVFSDAPPEAAHQAVRQTVSGSGPLALRPVDGDDTAAGTAMVRQVAESDESDEENEPPSPGDYRKPQLLGEYCPYTFTPFFERKEVFKVVFSGEGPHPHYRSGTRFFGTAPRAHAPEEPASPKRSRAAANKKPKSARARLTAEAKALTGTPSTVPVERKTRPVAPAARRLCNCPCGRIECISSLAVFCSARHRCEVHGHR